MLQASGGAATSTLPSQPHQDMTVITGNTVHSPAAATADQVSDIVSKQKTPPAVAAKPKQPSRHIDTSK